MNMQRWWPVWVWALGTGCPRSIEPAFNQAKLEAMEVVDVLPADWTPDVRLTLRQESISDALTTYSETADPLRTHLDLGMVELRPKLSISDLSLASRNPACSPCLRLQGMTEGTVKVSTALGSTRVPLSATFTLDVSLKVDPTPDGRYRLSAQAEEVRKLTVKSGMLHADLGTGMGVLRGWLEEALLDGLPPIELLDVDLGPYPVLGVRLLTDTNLLALDVRSNVPDTSPLTGDPSVPRHAWSLHMSQDVVLTMMQRASFDAGPFEVNKGPLSYLLLAEPRALAISPGGYEVELRLWSLNGRGWWRDYRATGPLTMQGKKVVAETDTIEAMDSSPGAFFSDPIGAIAQSRVLDALSEGISAPFDRRVEHREAQVRSVVRVTEIGGAGSEVHIGGTLKVEEQPRPTEEPSGARTRPTNTD